MSDAGSTKPDYVPDRLWSRLFQPWTLPESEWPLCQEDWQRVNTVCALPWKGHIIDFGAGDGTLAAMVCSRNPLVECVYCTEPDNEQVDKVWNWQERGWPMRVSNYPGEQVLGDGALCCEVLEHLTPEAGHQVLCDLKRVLKPGAMLCVTVPDNMGTRANHPGHITYFDGLYLRHAIVNAGFKMCALLPIDDPHHPIWLMAVAYA